MSSIFKAGGIGWEIRKGELELPEALSNVVS
jgi:hypothetical protein